VYRYLDDLLGLNITNFGEIAKKIYPKELTLE
jgi:hypothetical protein